MTDLELDAMMSINKAMKDLEPEAAKRVLRWAAERYATAEAVLPEEAPPATPNADQRPLHASSFGDIAELVSAAGPKTDVERALVGTYWFQVCSDEQSVTSQQVNTELKQLGYGAKNITDAFSGLISRRPQYALQVAKTGSSRQARKKYKLTGAGIKQVERMIANGGGADDD
jgi:hypothetical protein